MGPAVHSKFQKRVEWCRQDKTKMDRLDQPNENNSRITQVQKYGFVLPKKVKQFLLQL